MQFVQKHLTAHHLFHAPHRFFFAVILSPFHAAQMHYTKRYHLRFSHAKKLFFFDMLLLTFALFLFSASIFWHFYDPTIQDLVSIKVHQTTERITAGEKISYTISYINRSDVKIENTVITFQLPEGFIFENISPEFEPYFQKEKNSLNLNALAPGAHGNFELTGILIGTPNQDYESIVKMSYTQKNNDKSEYVISRILTAARETPLVVTFTSSDFALEKGALPFSLSAENQGNTLLKNIHIPLSQADQNLLFTDLEAHTGTITNNEWTIDELPAKASSTVHGSILTNFDSQKNSFTIEITAILSANQNNFPQKKISKNIRLLHPNIDAKAEIQEHMARAGDSVHLNIDIHNQNTLALENIEIILPLTEEIQKSKLNAQKNGIVRGNTFVINKNFERSLEKINPGETTHFTLPLPLAPYQFGTNIQILLHPEIQAHIAEIPGTTLTKKIETNIVKVASTLGLSGALRYFTLEGDQLGLGPLPPKVGKSTRYMTSFTLENSTGEVKNVLVKATLSPSVQSADKSSVSFGKNIVFDPITKTMSWETETLPAHSTVGINFAIFFTPQKEHIGAIVPLVQNIEVRGIDTETNLPLFTKISPLDSSLLGDIHAQNKGVRVVENSP